MVPIDVSNPSDHPAVKRAGMAHPLAACWLIASVAALATFIFASENQTTKTSSRLALPNPPTITPPLVEPEPPPRDVLRAKFFDQHVVPAIEETDALNREAAERCVVRLARVIDRYRQQVVPFVEDLTSISTRLGIMKRMPGGWWSEDGRVETYVAEKFEAHLFSEQSLMRDVAEVLEQFRVEVDINQKRMLASVQASLDTADLPEVSVEEYERFFASVAKQLSSYSAEQGRSSVYNAVTVLVISEAGSYAAITIVSGLLARFGAMAATSAVAAGGATAGASAAGAGGGSLAGPVGTAVGLGVGLVIGLAIDWWMTERFEDELTLQMSDYLDTLEETILYGAPSSQDSDSTETTQGISDALPLVCDQLKLAYRERFFEQIVLVEPSS
ncbi:MAG: hypothetical protein ACR2NZ_07145 [Rubripirellula sp.]